MSLISPQKPGEKSYEELVTLLTEHYNPAPSDIVERYSFHTRIRHEGEAVSTFVAELRSLARYCKFGASLNDLLRDRIVCGINDENIQRRLLAEKTLTLDSALDIAVGMESARKNVTELQTPVQKPTEVYKVTTTNCYRCGNSDHAPDCCRFRHVKCLTCGKTGQKKIEKELDRLMSLRILESIQFSEWASPIVSVLKSDGSVRICGDFKVTLN